MNTRYTIADTVIKAGDGVYFFTRYFNENFEYCIDGTKCSTITNKLRIIYDSYNGSASNVSLYHWTDNGWILFANDNTCNGARIEKYNCDKEKHLKAFEESCSALLNLWSKLT